MMRIASNNSLSSTSSSNKSNSSLNNRFICLSNLNRLLADQQKQQSALKHSSSVIYGPNRRFDPGNVQRRVLEWCQLQTKSYKVKTEILL